MSMLVIIIRSTIDNKSNFSLWKFYKYKITSLVSFFFSCIWIKRFINIYSWTQHEFSGILESRNARISMDCTIVTPMYDSIGHELTVIYGKQSKEMIVWLFARNIDSIIHHSIDVKCSGFMTISDIIIVYFIYKTSVNYITTHTVKSENAVQLWLILFDMLLIIINCYLKSCNMPDILFFIQKLQYF